VVLPFDPNDAWGQKERHHITGSIAGRPFRGPIDSAGDQYFLSLGAARLRDAQLPPGAAVEVTLAPEGPQVDRLSDDIALALDSDPQARAFFESLATFTTELHPLIEALNAPRLARAGSPNSRLLRGKRQK
jgi:hypothetical protein